MSLSIVITTFYCLLHVYCLPPTSVLAANLIPHTLCLLHMFGYAQIIQLHITSPSHAALITEKVLLTNVYHPNPILEPYSTLYQD